MAQTSGIRARHSRTCKSHDGGKCNCTPSYEAFVYSKRDKRKIRKTFPTLAAARGWRTDAGKAVKDRQLRAALTRTLAEEVEAFLAGARDGSILSRRETPYKPAVIRGYELSLRLRVLPTLGQFRLADIELSDLLALKEDLQRDGVSGGTLRNTFVPLQAIYRRARQHGLVAIDPTIDLSLPTSGVRNRAATQAEAVEVLDAFHDSVIEGCGRRRSTLGCVAASCAPSECGTSILRAASSAIRRARRSGRRCFPSSTAGTTKRERSNRSPPRASGVCSSPMRSCHT